MLFIPSIFHVKRMKIANLLHALCSLGPIEASLFIVNFRLLGAYLISFACTTHE